MSDKHNLSRLAAMWCADAQFRAWFREQHPRLYVAAENGWAFGDDEIAAVVLRKVCKVQSRSEFDSDEAAASRFHDLVRKPWVAAQEAMQRAEWTT